MLPEFGLAGLKIRADSRSSGEQIAQPLNFTVPALFLRCFSLLVWARTLLLVRFV
jgi:hypothetical protein